MIYLNSTSESENIRKEFKLNDTDKKTILYFIDNNNESAYPAKIAAETGITKKSIGKSCKKLEDYNILLSKIDTANNGFTKYYYLGEFPKILEILNADCDSGFLVKVMRTKYYRAQINNLIEYLDSNLELNGYNKLTEDDKEALQICLKYSISCLGAVLSQEAFDLCSNAFLQRYKEFKSQSMECGALITLSALDDVIIETKSLDEKEKATFRRKLYEECILAFALFREEVSDLVEKNLIPFMCADMMKSDYSVFYFNNHDEVKQIALDKAKLDEIEGFAMSDYLYILDAKRDIVKNQ